MVSGTALVMLSCFVTNVTQTPFAVTTMPNTRSKPMPPMSLPRKGWKRTNSSISTHSTTKEKKKQKELKGNGSDASDEAIDKGAKHKRSKKPR